VLFSFAAVYDDRTGSPFADVLRVNDQPLRVEASSPTTVDITFPAPYGPGLRLLDGFPIYPRHRLAPALASGTLGKAWGPTTPVDEIAGLGPFVLERYEPGQRLVLRRNDHYWRSDENGRKLPRLDRVRIEIVPEQNAELLRLQAGQVDVLQSDLRPEDYAPLKGPSERGRVRLLDVGTSYDTFWLWFNLGPSSDRRRPWLKRDEFRRALSHAVDRERFVETVFLGAAEPAWSPVSPANKSWYSEAAPKAAFDRAHARTLLAGIGLTDRNGDDVLEDESGNDVRFTVLIQKGVTGAEKGMAFLRDELAQIGVGLDVAALDLGGVMTRWSKGDYDAVYHWMIATDTDPGGNLDMWLSSGDSHVWNPAQLRPATDWEREIDALMRKQVATIETSERRRLFDDVQRIFAEHSPALIFAVPRVYVATSARVEHATPAVHRPQILWNPDVLSVQR
jgi:peptide/nickel transport system substrate-binding protein